MNSSNQTAQSLASDDSGNGRGFSLATRLLNGIIIIVLFTVGIATNVIVLHVLRRKRILLKNTLIILTNLMINDLICCVFVLPYDFAHYVLQLSFAQGKEAFRVCFAIRTVVIFLNCSFTTALNIERHITTTFVGKKNGKHLSKPLKLCLTTIWLAGLGEAVITYCTFRNRDHFPRKLPGQTNDFSAHYPSAGIIITMFLILVATLTILFSLYRMRSFLQQLLLDIGKSIESSCPKGEWRLCRMHKRINLACLASLATLAISYFPMVTVILLRYTLELHSSDANAVAYVLCSMAHTINPLIAIAMSQRIQNAFFEVLRMFYQSCIPRRSVSMRRKGAPRTSGEITRMAVNKTQNNQEPVFPNITNNDNESSTTATDEIFQRIIAKYMEHKSTIQALKKTPHRQNSLPAAKRSQVRIRTYSAPMRPVHV